MKFKMGRYSGDIEVLHYGNLRIALRWSNEEFGPLATITVNLPDYEIQSDEVIIDTNNLNHIGEAIKELKAQGIIGDKVGEAVSGYCTYPIHKCLITK